MADTTREYDLSRPVQTMDGRPITAAGIGIPPSWDELQETEDGEDCTADSYVKDACPVARALRFICILDEKPDGDKKLTKKRKEEIRADKEKRFDLGMTLMQAMRLNGAKSVKLSNGDVEMLLNLAASYMATEPFGCVRQALKTPILTQDEKSDGDGEAEKQEE